MDDTIALIRKSHDGDKKAREELVEKNIGLIWCVVKRFYGRGAAKEIHDKGWILEDYIEHHGFAYNLRLN